MFAVTDGWWPVGTPAKITFVWIVLAGRSCQRDFAAGSIFWNSTGFTRALEVAGVEFTNGNQPGGGLSKTAAVPDRLANRSIAKRL